MQQRKDRIPGFKGSKGLSLRESFPNLFSLPFFIPPFKTKSVTHVFLRNIPIDFRLDFGGEDGIDKAGGGFGKTQKFRLQEKAFMRMRNGK